MEEPFFFRKKDNMTKVYLIQESRGVWEDYYTYIKEAYSHKEDAESRKAELEWEENQKVLHSNRCDTCPITEDIPVPEDYCPYASEVKYVTDGYFKCDKEVFGHDAAYYNIVEIEVF